MTPVIGILVFFSGCNKPMPNPESLDPIFNDFRAEEEKAIRQVTEVEGNIQDKKKELGKMDKQNPARSGSLREIRASEQKLVELRQRVTFYHLRAESRKAYDQDTYSTAFGQKKEKNGYRIGKLSSTQYKNDFSKPRASGK